MSTTDMPHTDLPGLGDEARADFAGRLTACQGQLYGYIHSLVRDLNDADDLFQQVAIILWRKFADYDPSRSFLAWACGVARFEASNFLRTRGRSRLYLSDELNLMLIDAQVSMTNDETEARREALSRCLGKLRERDRALLQECYSDESSVAATAERTGRSPQSVHNSLRRIRRSLFECIRRTISLETQLGAAS